MLAALVTSFLLTPPVSQDPAYHAFADGRTLLAVSNFWNVASNLPFLVVGVWGLAYVQQRSRRVCLPGLRRAYIVFFAGVTLTAFGSGYYHLNPANGPLVWDRLPMTIGFAGLFSIILGEFVSARAGRRILAPLLIIGVASVAYWAFTESYGIGDLRPYAVVQFLPMLLIPFILLMYSPTIGSKKYYWFMLLFYVLAKVFEYFDTAIFANGELLSGHTLKHLFAAMTPATLLYALHARRLSDAVTSNG
ncbi:MAG: alkaline phytoceramidase [Gammaproteobacteria bacterium]|nr:alkaline phytoceramidase [Gammaproteobacteria bacterium]MDH3372786.1 alkaline phytoceramidase [Gammaproteobacteria bacterium]MDH3408088.1 alkaline phytoceramidase [Gammaproteobacteria bacterium]